MATLTYSDSGQVYTEITYHNTPLPIPWTHKTKGSSTRRRKRKAIGTSTLFQHAVCSLLANTSLLAANSFEGVPWSLATQIWSTATRSNLDSVKLWQAFITAYPSASERDLRRRYVKHIRHIQENVPLGFYTEPMIATNGAWLAILTLENITLPRSDLIHPLAALSTLAVLTIGERVNCIPDAGIDDDIVKAWSRHAVEDENGEAFRMLRCLNLRKQPDVTSRALRYLRRLPKLVILNMQGCGILRPGKDELAGSGWRYRTAEMASPFSETGNVWGSPHNPNWDVVSHRCLDLADTLAEQTGAAAATSEQAKETLPRLHLILGEDMGWTEGLGGSMQGFQTMVTFVRAPEADSSTISLGTKSRKRSSDEGAAFMRRVTKRKATLRASTEQDLCGSLLKFAA